jgi:single-strand DNA-binding protein
MEITGRVTRNAEIKNVSGDRKLVAFSIAVNDSYKPKNREKKDLVTYFNCAYWLSTTIAKSITQGSIVSCYGRIEMNIWKDGSGEPRGSLNFHVNNIRFVSKGKSSGAKNEEAIPSTETGQTEDDLPF